MTQLPKQLRARVLKVARDNFWARIRAYELPSGEVVKNIDGALDDSALIAAQNAYVAGLVAALTDLHRMHPDGRDDLRRSLRQLIQAHGLTTHALQSANLTPYDVGELAKITTTEREKA